MPDMVEPVYILFEARRGEFAFGCVTGSFAGGAQTNDVAFNWSGNDAMNEASGEGWAELQFYGSLQGEISFQNGDDIFFLARPWPASSTAC